MTGRGALLRREEGGVFPVFLFAMLVIFTMTMVVLQVGRGGELRTRAQTAADAAALGAAAEIRDRALEAVTNAFLPYASFDQETTPQAAKRYAQENGATVTKVEHGDFFGHTVAVDVQTNDSLGGFYDKLSNYRGTARAVATVEFPACSLTFNEDDHLIGTTCADVFVPIGADPSRFIDLFRIHLVPELPPLCGFGGLPVGSGETVRPVADITPSSGFGSRTHPITGETSFHGGTDYAEPEGSPIYAFAEGVVVAAGAADGFGQWIVIDHNLNGQKVSSVYGHMWPQDLLVKEGQHVRAGQQIARVGNNGHSTGAHLHFELWRGGRLSGGQNFDPHPSVQQAKPPNGAGVSKGENPAELSVSSGNALGCGPLGSGGGYEGSPGDAKLCASAAQTAGFTGRQLVVITAIGMAESSCRPDAKNINTNGSGDYGLFQINSIHGYDLNCLYDPVCNARAAFKISAGGSNFYPWCTYDAPACNSASSNGAYREFLGTAEKAVQQLKSSGDKQK